MIAFLAAGLTGLALGTFSGLWSTGHSDHLRFVQVLGAPGKTVSRQPLPELAMHLVFTQDANTLITRQLDGQIMAWDRGTGKPELLAHTTGAFAYCASDHRLVVSNEAAAVSLSLEDGRFEHLAGGHHDHAVFSENCAALALATSSKPEVQLLRSSDVPERLATALPVRNGLSLSPTGDQLAVAGGTMDNTDNVQTTIEIFDLAPFKPEARLVSSSQGVVGLWSMQFENSGKGLFLGSHVLGQNGLRRIDPASGSIVWGHDGFEGEWVHDLATAPGGTYLASGDDKGQLRLWDIETGVMLADHNAGQLIQSLAFSPDGTLIAVALWDGTIGIVPLAALL
ncbi:MAG: WD40 repeat domain-containing protein [Paracoccaceae bacterium]